MDSDNQFNKGLLDALLEMGFDEEMSKQALISTGNQSIESATTFLLNDGLTGSGVEVGSDEDQWEDVEENYKMVFVVNTCLKMSIGKTAAQVGHGAIGIYRILVSDPQHQVSLAVWTDVGETKIVLKGESAEQLLELQEKAKSSGIPSCLIRDAGHTEIAPNSITVLALFGLEENINKITGSLQLLK
uniref:peptidyl-tRNA hydrolase n=1 Tax=Clastoptera arizonana TaxID=38151 RepID=A0A1B6DMY3_9HEMI